METTKNKTIKKKAVGMPKGGKKKDTEARREILMEQLSKYKNKRIRNIDTNKSVKITNKGIKEIAHHAAKSRISSMAALDLPRQIKKAKYKSTNPPKQNKQVKEFHAVAIEELQGSYKKSRTKITLAVKQKKKRRNGTTRTKNDRRMYCITAKQ